MDILTDDIRCCILIRGTRSSTTREMINSYCEKYGQINYSRCAFSPQGIMRGYDVVYKQEQSVNSFMDNRPHHIDGQSVKVKRCISPNEEWRLTSEIVLTTSDNSTDKQIFQKEVLCDYFSKYGSIRACHIDTRHVRPCAYLTFADYDRVDQLINDKPHLINKVMLNIRKHVRNDKKTQRIPMKKTPIKRRMHSSEHSRIKQTRLSSTICTKRKMNSENDTTMHEVPSSEFNETVQLQNEYQRLNTQIQNVRDEHADEILYQLEHDVENLLEKIHNRQHKEKTFTDRLFEKYTVQYILSLNENDINQRIEQLEKESQLLRLIKQNMSIIKSS